MDNILRSHTCNEISAKHLNEEVLLSGWIHKKRDHGSLIFIDLRDYYGLSQCVVEQQNESIFKIVAELKHESVIQVKGIVVKRDESTINPSLPTGQVEVIIKEIKILSHAKVLPILVDKNDDAPEELRLKYRFLDLRREESKNRIIKRSKIISFIRNKMESLGFLEITTPILTASSPEGARDYLVPSRKHPGKFYALPQAPQQFKQLLMVSGFDKYFQIAPCFRDEDARADRTPGEFYQLDFEMSFVTQEEVFEVLQEVLFETFDKFKGNKKITNKIFPKITYADSMLKYGTDKPDLRNPLEMCIVSDVFANSNFTLFANQVKNGNIVKAIPAPNTHDKPRSFFDKMNDWARKQGQGGLGYIKFEKNNEAKGPIASKLNEEQLLNLQKLTKTSAGDSIFFIADNKNTINKFAAIARTKIAEELSLISNDTFEFCFIIDFPMFEISEMTNQLDFSHNPFSMPQGGLEALNTKDPLDIKAYQYDIVCNGIELSSGAIRNHDINIMKKAFEIAGITFEEMQKNYSAMLNAFSYGAPPHGGAAPGIDRIIMLLTDSINIREIIPFPLNQNAEDLLMKAPNEVSNKQLDDLFIKKVPVPKKDSNN